LYQHTDYTPVFASIRILIKHRSKIASEGDQTRFIAVHVTSVTTDYRERIQLAALCVRTSFDLRPRGTVGWLRARCTSRGRCG